MFGQEELLDCEVDLTKSLLSQRRALQQILHKRRVILSLMPGACTSVLLGHWLGPSLEECNLNSQAEVNQKEVREAVN